MRCPIAALPCGCEHACQRQTPGIAKPLAGIHCFIDDIRVILNDKIDCEEDIPRVADEHAELIRAKLEQRFGRKSDNIAGLHIWNEIMLVDYVKDHLNQYGNWHIYGLVLYNRSGIFAIGPEIADIIPYLQARGDLVDEHRPAEHRLGRGGRTAPPRRVRRPS